MWPWSGVPSTASCRVAPTVLAATLLARTLPGWSPCSRSSVPGPAMTICLPLRRLSCFGHCLIRVYWPACRMPRAVHLPAPSETELLWALSSKGVMAGLLVALMPWERPGVRYGLVFETLQYFSSPHLSLLRPRRSRSQYHRNHPGPVGPSPVQWGRPRLRRALPVP